MADAHVTLSSANVEEQECFVCKKQFGASDLAVTLSCNQKSCLTCMSEQEAEKLLAKQPISGRQCMRDFSSIEISVNSRTLMTREEDGHFLETSLKPLFDYAKSAVIKFVALCTTLWHHFVTSSQAFWEVTKKCLVCIFVRWAIVPILVWIELQDLRSSTLFKETVRVIRNNCGSLLIFVYHIIRASFFDLPNDKPDTFEEVNYHIYCAIKTYFLVGSLINIVWIMLLALKTVYMDYHPDSLAYEEMLNEAEKPHRYLGRVFTHSWHLYLLWLSLYYAQRRLRFTS